MKTVLALMLAALSLAAAAAQPPEANQPSAKLHALFAREWQRFLREHPVEASLNGFHQYDDRWPDLAPAAFKASHEADERALADLEDISRSALPEKDQVNYDLFAYRLKDRLAADPFHDYVLALNQLGGIQTSGSLARELRFNNADDYRHWIDRLQHFDRHMDQTIELLRLGLEAGMTEPHVVMKRIPHQIKAQIVSDPAKSQYYQPFKHMPATIPAAEQAKLRDAARKAISGVVVPAFKKFDTFFNDTYLPNTRKTIAASRLPNGKAYYAYVVRHYTTTDMTPKQIHALGLKRVAEIHAQMEKIFRQIGFKGSYREFLHELRTDPRFYYKKPDGLLEAYRAAAKRVDPNLVKFFPVDLLPRVTYGVRPIPASLAPDTYPAYSVPPAGDGSVAGYMDVNLYKPESRPKYDIQVLTCHEARPGHQLQIPVGMELKNLPNFRRFQYINAYGEGWALYAETLCDEMGLYDDPYARFGYLNYQMWRAVRLVVDTGMHAFGWSRDRAIKYFEDNTALSVENITNEVDRYIAWPAQALSYMTGEIAIQKLRHEAESKLGSNFDIRAFHGVVLGHGSMPMAVLKRQVEKWIQEQKAAASSSQK